MNYYIDTEFHEYKKQLKVLGIKIGKPIPTIDLISIGIVSEDGREYYAISKDFNLKDAWNSYQMELDEQFAHALQYKKVFWLRENVLKPIFNELYVLYQKEILRYRNQNDVDNYYINIGNNFTLKNFKKLINIYGKTNKEIAEEIEEFIACQYKDLSTVKTGHPNFVFDSPKFYAYYSAYDWVVFCQLFGKMINLPKGFPMFAFDLKQEMDSMYMEQKEKIEGESRLTSWLNTLENSPQYPKQENEHNALDDAKWNKKLHKFLKQLKK